MKTGVFLADRMMVSVLLCRSSLAAADMDARLIWFDGRLCHGRAGVVERISTLDVCGRGGGAVHLPIDGVGWARGISKSGGLVPPVSRLKKPVWIRLTRGDSAEGPVISHHQFGTVLRNMGRVPSSQSAGDSLCGG
ncbi:hypothetical protein HNQ59_003790 [Chitinivorax tropicus]|uniref:Uncharacterized protein n=1 Tax=Chitinivorax tropicus TaxID=714531 RepID=A0A840MPV3_9PROT|nr:hypothetical protein [Chitinivorax tropicus]